MEHNIYPETLHDFNPVLIDKEAFFELYFHSQRIVEEDLLMIQQVETLAMRYKDCMSEKIKILLLRALEQLANEIPVNEKGYDIIDDLSKELLNKAKPDMSRLEDILDEMTLGLYRISDQAKQQPGS